MSHGVCSCTPVHEPCVCEQTLCRTILGLETHLISGLGFRAGFEEQLPEVI